MKFLEYILQREEELGFSPNGQAAFTWLMNKFHGSPDTFEAEVRDPQFVGWLVEKFDIPHEVNEVLEAVKESLGG